MIPLFHGLFLSTLFFIIGLLTIIIRRNLLFMLLGLEILNNSASLALVIAGSFLNQVDGQIMYILSVTLAACEISIALAILVQIYRQYKTLNIDMLSEISK